MVKPKRIKSSKKKRNHASHNEKPASSIQKSQRLLLTPSKPRRKTSRPLPKSKALESLSGKKPMPSLSELEKMYEETDSEEEEAKGDNTGNAAADQHNSSSFVVPLSPTTAKKYADEVLKILDGNEEPPPIIPMKKYKKSGVPYIVNCTARPRIPENKNICNLFKGDDYGITSKTNDFSIDSTSIDSSGFSYNCNGPQFSKSIFNAQANEIASRLLSPSNNPINGSDSDNTEGYEMNTADGLDGFSPQPSTSNDSEIIQSNDQKFNECFNQRNKIKETVVLKEHSLFVLDVENNTAELQVISKPQCNIQTHGIVDKLLQTNNDTSCDFHDIEIVEQPCETIVIDDDDDSIHANTRLQTISIDDDCEIIGVNKINEKKHAKLTKNTNNIPKMVEDYHNPFDPHVIDAIDLTSVNYEDMLSENLSLINKYSKLNTLNTVNLVKADVIATCSKANTNTYENVNTIESQVNQNNAHQSTNLSTTNTVKANVVATCSKKNKNTNKNVNTIQCQVNLNNAPQTTNQSIELQNYVQTYLDYPDHLDNILTDFFSHLKESNNSFSTQKTNLSSHEKIMPNISLNNDLNSPQSKNSLSENLISQHALGTCPICLDDLSRDTVGSTNCGHLFCLPCITAALKTKPKRCPSCRKKLTGKGYHQIFL
ncbi:uncharacterized protein LOC112055314 [Bicyclus anynana]|uniref:Uncharacterized protein LOC112055314 n=1 Tax=Bicyclus anynana TaxID=110368 RepID=A0A6J1NTW8_BICAN|nr:uncharacterized protein LOC112055314 [Bicyclus anynana]